MKLIRIFTMVLFAAILVVPLVLFNTEPHSVSLIDNRELTENPFTLEGDLTANVQSYINDRIGLRDEMIAAYTIGNDKLFGKMVHPSYTYGKEGYVFGAGLTTANNFGEFHIAFADMVAEIQAYCDARSVPFLFVFNPAKPAVYEEYIADGVNYNREWVTAFFAELDKRNVRYVDNTQVMLELKTKGIHCFNQKYDANHWNDLGAFYGTQNILKELSKTATGIHVNQLSEFIVEENTQTSLMVSQFPINERVPAMSLKTPIDSLYQEYFHELTLHPSYRTFGYHINNSDAVKDTPKALVFQGSYMNGYGNKYFDNAFHEYVYVHDYQNVMNFPYYFNIFRPECVIFEVAEYTFQNGYFNYDKMKAVSLPPAMENTAHTAVEASAQTVTVTQGKTLTTLTWKTDAAPMYVWLQGDVIYDMTKVDGGYEVTVETARYHTFSDTLTLYVSDQ